MQATVATGKQSSSSEELARELVTLFSYLYSNSTPDFFRALSEADVTLTQVKLLHVLDRPDADRTLKDLAEEMSFSLAGASRSIDALHQRGLVERREDEHDRRMKRVRITPDGQELLRRLNEMRVSLLAQFVEDIPDSQRRELLDALSPIVGREEIAAFRPQGAPNSR
jgi:DNA-binding MarR family transcriptional regulator